VVATAFTLGCSPGVPEAQLQPPATPHIDRGRMSMVLDQAARASGLVWGRTYGFVAGTAPQAAAPAIASSVRYSRAEALHAGAEPPPTDIRRELEPYFGEDLMDEVTWTLAGHRLSLGSILASWYFDEAAVTLQDVLVFSSPRASRNLWLWAHELAHVEQYRRWGVNGFSARYAADWAGIERAASRRADAVIADIRRRRAEASTAARPVTRPDAAAS
jgi:hypothetical protein